MVCVELVQVNHHLTCWFQVDGVEDGLVQVDVVELDELVQVDEGVVNELVQVVGVVAAVKDG